MFEVGDQVRDTIYPRKGVVVQVVSRGTSGQPNILVEWTAATCINEVGQRDWCNSAEIKVAD